MSKIFTRPARQAKYLWSYLGHAVQGFVVGLFVPILFIPLLYVSYQMIEYAAYYLRNKDRAYTANDTPSRDIADFTIGYWAGSFVTLLGLACWFAMLYN